jgi:hypothetical protein
MHVLDLKHGIRPAIQPLAIFNGGEIRIGGHLLREPLDRV